MATSLDFLVKNLPANTFNNLSYFYSNTKVKLELLKRKGVYMYDYMDSFENYLKNSYRLEKLF